MSKIRMKQGKSFIFALFLLFFLFSANFAFALEIKYPKIPGVSTPQQFLKEIEEGTIEKEKALPLYVKYVFYLSLMIAGLLALGSTIFGGVKYLISGGNVPAMKDARETISSGILGLVLLFSSYLILYLLNPQLAIFHIEIPSVPEVSLEPIKPYEPEVPVFVEIPYANRVERVKTAAEVAKFYASQVNYIGAEEENNNHASIAELTKCLEKLTKECKCDMITESCKQEGDDCSVGKCKDPCKRDITEDFCQEIDEAIVLPVNLREAIEEIKAIIEATIPIFLEEKETLRRVQYALKVELVKLKAAEFLMSYSVNFTELYNSPINRDSFRVLKEKEKTEERKLAIWTSLDLQDTEEISFPSHLLEDPANFYVPEEGNKEIITYVQSICYEDVVPPPPPDDWPPPPPPQPGKLQWPLVGEVTSPYGCIRYPCYPRQMCCDGDMFRNETEEIIYQKRIHWGIDIAAPRFTPIKPAAKGTVIYVDNRDDSAAGKWITLFHEELGLSTRYLHLEEIKVKVGQMVAANSTIATNGSTGTSTGPHLHFEVYPCYTIGGQYAKCLAVDPMGYLP